ncbi:MAG TPA: hypothetical protein ENK57_17245 [Polyangiaceae bacterium]|nr:hypothetical protein [Polyangiaceae bacterium]
MQPVHTSIAIFALTLLLPGIGSAQDAETAPAEEPTDASGARERFDVAVSLYTAGRFAEAAREFEAAYELDPRPRLLHNIYLSYRDLGDRRASAVALRRYLESDADIPDEHRLILQHRLDALEAVLASEAASSDEPGTEPGQSAPDNGAGDDTSGEPAAAEPTGDSGEEGSVLMPLGIASFATAGAGLLLMGVAGGLALDERSSLESTCAPGCTDAQISGAATLGVLADVGLGVAIGGAVLGTILVIAGVLEPSGSADVQVGVGVGATHGRLTVGGAL